MSGLENINEKRIGHGEEFVQLLLGLEAVELCALCKVLGVRILTDEVDPETKKAIPRDAVEIIDECIEHYGALGRTDRRFLLKHLKKHQKKG